MHCEAVQDYLKAIWKLEQQEASLTESAHS
jgi:hypothetical protein